MRPRSSTTQVRPVRDSTKRSISRSSSTTRSARARGARLVTYLEGFAEAIGGLHVDIEETWDLGETIVLAVAQSGRGSASDVPVAQPFTWVLEFESGPRCVRWRIYADRQRAFEAAGLRE